MPEGAWGSQICLPLEATNQNPTSDKAVTNRPAEKCHTTKKPATDSTHFILFSPLKRRPLQCCVSLLQTTEVSRVFGLLLHAVLFLQQMQMRNSEYSSTFPSTLLSRLRERTVELPVRVQRDRQRSHSVYTLNGIRNFEESFRKEICLMGEPVRRLCVWSTTL